MSQAGKFRIQITLQKRGFTQGTGGAEKPTFSDQVTVYASMHGLRGRERYDSDKRDADATVRFTVRYDSSLDFLREKDRVKYVKGARTRTFDIIFINNRNERDRVVDIECRERPS